jgi:hypothetical protein
MKLFVLALLLTLPAVAADAPADDSSSPFPAGDGAALTRQICTRCHSASLITAKSFDLPSAERYWRTMVGTDPNSEEALTVIRYLSTVLASDDDGPDSALR